MLCLVFTVSHSIYGSTAFQKQSAKLGGIVQSLKAVSLNSVVSMMA